MNILETFIRTRRFTEAASSHLTEADQVVQSIPDVSPTKWHRAHTTWFFETFVVAAFDPHYSSPFPGYSALFNSYYESVGARHPRHQRGHITRPGASEVGEYRAEIDQRVTEIITREGADKPALTQIIQVGCQHEQQHLELLLMDIKHVFSENPLGPAVFPLEVESTPSHEPLTPKWIATAGGVVEIGAGLVGDSFSFDNESSRHKVFLDDYELSSSLVTNGEWLDFINDGGYREHRWWLSDGWARVREEQWSAPLYWLERDGQWLNFTHQGFHSLDLNAPVAHVSHFEADAYARWAGARLPTEAEWEHAVTSHAITPTSADSATHPFGITGLHPRHTSGKSAFVGVFDSLWQWTSSAYLPYPGFQAADGALGEYNGKFMSNQMVLRGGASITPVGHTRATYRNFFPPHSRWMYSGVRLAR